MDFRLVSLALTILVGMPTNIKITKTQKNLYYNLGK